jgi:hypothetical protein
MICVLLANEDLRFLTKRNNIGVDQDEDDVYEENKRLADNVNGKII